MKRPTPRWFIRSTAPAHHLNRIRPVLRRGFQVVLALGLLVALTGCTPDPPIYARTEDGLLKLLLCDPEDADFIVISSAPRGTVHYEVIWSLAGPANLEPGAELQFGETFATWSTVSAPVGVDLSNAAISVALKKSSVDQTILGAKFGGWDLSETSWTSASGSAVDEPCGTSR
jgi:hypothetical protein